MVSTTAILGIIVNYLTTSKITTFHSLTTASVRRPKPLTISSAEMKMTSKVSLHLAVQANGFMKTPPAHVQQWKETGKGLIAHK